MAPFASLFLCPFSLVTFSVDYYNDTHTPVLFPLLLAPTMEPRVVLLPRPQPLLLGYLAFNETKELWVFEKDAPAGLELYCDGYYLTDTTRWSRFRNAVRPSSRMVLAPSDHVTLLAKKTGVPSFQAGMVQAHEWDDRCNVVIERVQLTEELGTLLSKSYGEGAKTYRTDIPEVPKTEVAWVCLARVCRPARKGETLWGIRNDLAGPWPAPTPPLHFGRMMRGLYAHEPAVETDGTGLALAFPPDTQLPDMARLFTECTMPVLHGDTAGICASVDIQPGTFLAFGWSQGDLVRSIAKRPPPQAPGAPTAARGPAIRQRVLAAGQSGVQQAVPAHPVPPTVVAIHPRPILDTRHFLADIFTEGALVIGGEMPLGDFTFGGREHTQCMRKFKAFIDTQNVLLSDTMKNPAFVEDLVRRAVDRAPVVPAPVWHTIPWPVSFIGQFPALFPFLDGPSADMPWHVHGLLTSLGVLVFRHVKAGERLVCLRPQEPEVATYPSGPAAALLPHIDAVIEHCRASGTLEQLGAALCCPGGHPWLDQFAGILPSCPTIEKPRSGSPAYDELEEEE